VLPARRRATGPPMVGLDSNVVGYNLKLRPRSIRAKVAPDWHHSVLASVVRRVQRLIERAVALVTGMLAVSTARPRTIALIVA